MRTVEIFGEQIPLVDKPIEVGQSAPEFTAQLTDLGDVTLASHAGKTRIYCAVPSLDTGTCDTEMRRFNKEAASMSGVVVVCVSMDLPLAQKRWCGVAEADNIITASDHRAASFGRAYGCLMDGGKMDRFLYRSVFVVGPDDVVKHVEYLDALGNEPNYEAALAAAK